MAFKNIIAVLLLAVVADNIVSGSPYYNKRNLQTRKGWSDYPILRQVAGGAGKNANNNEVKNEYAIIRQARKARRFSNPSAVQTKSWSGPSPLFGSGKTVVGKKLYGIPSSYNEFPNYAKRSSSTLRGRSPGRKISLNPRGSPFQNAPATLANRQKTNVFGPQVPDYIY